MFEEISREEMENVEGGCGWCYTGAVLVIVGGFLTGGLGGAALGALGVVGVLLN